MLLINNLVFGCRFNILNSFVTKVFNFRNLRFDKVEIEYTIYNSSLSFPLLALTERYSFTHGSHDGSDCEGNFRVSIEVLVGVKILDKIRMAKIHHNFVN